MARMATTTGTVVKSEIGTTLSGTQGSSIQFPEVTYQYTVNGQTYFNNKVSQTMVRSLFGSVVQQTLNRYPVGSTVTVHYNADNPQDAYLEKGPRQVNFAHYRACRGYCGNLHRFRGIHDSADIVD